MLLTKFHTTLISITTIDNYCFFLLSYTLFPVTKMGLAGLRSKPTEFKFFIQLNKRLWSE